LKNIITGAILQVFFEFEVAPDPRKPLKSRDVFLLMNQHQDVRLESGKSMRVWGIGLSCDGKVTYKPIGMLPKMITVPVSMTE
jgi:hypothetical protein